MDILFSIIVLVPVGFFVIKFFLKREALAKDILNNWLKDNNFDLIIKKNKIFGHNYGFMQGMQKCYYVKISRSDTNEILEFDVTIGSFLFGPREKIIKAYRV